MPFDASLKVSSRNYLRNLYQSLLPVDYVTQVSGQDTQGLIHLDVQDEPISVLSRRPHPDGCGSVFVLVVTLQGMVSELVTRLGEGRSIRNQVTDAFFALLDLPGHFGYFASTVSGDNDDPVGICHNNVARVDTDLPNAHRLIDCPDLNPVLAGSHPPSCGEERVAVADRSVHVAAHPVDHRSRNASTAGVLRHDIAPDRTIGATPVINNHDIANGYIVEEIPDAAGRVASRNVPDRERRAYSHFLVMRQRQDPARLARNPQFIEGVRDSRGVRSRKQRDQLFILRTRLLRVVVRASGGRGRGTAFLADRLELRVVHDLGDGLAGPHSLDHEVLPPIDALG